MDPASVAAIVVALLGAGGFGAMLREFLGFLSKKYADKIKHSQVTLEREQASDNAMLELYRDAMKNFVEERQLDREACEEGRRLDRESCGKQNANVLRRISQLQEQLLDRSQQIHDANVKAHQDNRHEFRAAIMAAVAPLLMKFKVTHEDVKAEQDRDREKSPDADKHDSTDPGSGRKTVT